MPVEAATYIHDLAPANPLHTDTLGQADAHLRLLKTVLQTTFPNLTAPVTATPTALNAAAGAFSGTGVTTLPGTPARGAQEFLAGPTSSSSGSLSLFNSAAVGAAAALEIGSNSADNTIYTRTATLDAVGNFAAIASLNAPSIKKNGSELIPPGVIVLWSGAVSAIPAGWLLCDGTNGTPNLLARFVTGAGLGVPAGTTGGAASVSVQTDIQGAHNHGGRTGTPDSADLLDVAVSGTVPYAASYNHYHPISSDSGHFHSVTVPTVPPYYALAYIMKS